MGNRASRTSPACPVGRAPMWPRGDINSLGRQPSRYLGCGCRAGSPSAPKYTEHPSPRAEQRQHTGQSPQASFGWCAPTHGGAIVRGRRHDSPRETGNPSRKQQAGEEAREAKYWAIRLLPSSPMAGEKTLGGCWQGDFAENCIRSPRDSGLTLCGDQFPVV